MIWAGEWADTSADTEARDTLSGFEPAHLASLHFGLNQKRFTHMLH